MSLFQDKLRGCLSSQPALAVTPASSQNLSSPIVAAVGSLASETVLFACTMPGEGAAGKGQQGEATKEASKEETYRGRAYPHNLSPHRTSHLVDDSTAGAHVSPQKANLRLTPMPEAACRQEQPSSPVIALSPGPIRFRRTKVEAPNNGPSRNDTVRRGRWTSGVAMGWRGGVDF